ncbi:hypothetical protein PR202_gb03874 [Eleusine coracana subsp. coracana]|uniref:Uncharacterized protein n=1 Tax=Eleusine coracana subsp. coracana TaxID=191504 RepID=A0AAV5E2K1_ELECO|nr:hypothetical protein PR202_gb03874 [Eleusine coracana subsp. coracana]
MALTKASTAAMLLLALLVAAAAAVNPSTDAADQRGIVGWMVKGGSGRRGGSQRSSHDDGEQSPLKGVTQCVTTCGTQVTACFLQCYKPPVSGADPVTLPLCLLTCTNNAMICANSCSSNIV